MPRYDISIRVAATRYTITEAKPKLEPKHCLQEFVGSSANCTDFVQEYMTAVFSCQLIFREVREDQKMEEYTIVANTKGKADVWRHFGLRKRKADGTSVEKTVVCLTCNTVVKTSGCTFFLFINSFMMYTNYDGYSIHAQNKRFISSHLCLYT